ncbi:MAG TPA: hypothetical protein VLL54_15955 [Pyrinomonadaceae bacterium]|nr:hypothetical protein [Pyrinomonadaceae bacterium]
MRAIKTLLLIVLTLSFSAIASGQKASESVSIKITEQAETYVITVPVSELLLTIPKNGLKRIVPLGQGATDSPRYFIFEDAARHLILSGWFESDDQFGGIKKYWTEAIAARKKKNVPDALDVSFEKLGSWNTILFDTASQLIGVSNIEAHWVQHGTWIDLHLSLTSNDSKTERRQKLRDALTAIEVSEKKP